MAIEAGKVYRNGDGETVHIMGPARHIDTGKPYPDRFWALNGNHYHADGRMVHRERSGRHAINIEPIGVHSDAGKGEGWAHSHCTVCEPDC